MGKWSTYRKRGTPSAAAALGPPPKPYLEIFEADVVQTAAGADDTGGTCNLESSDDAGLTWDWVAVEPWLGGVLWGPAAQWQGLLLRANETGNGTTYAGVSEWSTVLEIPA